MPIAEGCVSNCSYCSVKFARRELRSFPPEDIIEEIRRELKNGRKEIYVTTQDTGAYGLDIDMDLPELLKKISSIPKKFRVRVGMMNPKQAKRITDDLIDSYMDEKIYKFLHLPIQSGNDRILDKMRREYTVEDFRETVDQFRKSCDDLYLATDIIVGFPGKKGSNRHGEKDSLSPVFGKGRVSCREWKEKRGGHAREGIQARDTG